MKLVNLKALTLLLFAGGAMYLASCKKESSDVPATEADLESTALIAVQDAVADELYEDASNVATGIDDATAGDDLGIYGNDGYGVFGGQANLGGSDLQARNTDPRCFTVTVTPMEKGVFPKTVTVDFGSGCVGKDARLRKGKVITVYTGRMHAPGSTATTTFDGYSVNGFDVSGTVIVTNLSTSNNRAFKREIKNGRIANSLLGKVCEWSAVRTLTQVEGNGTPFFPPDDIFRMTGWSRGATNDGKTWDDEIIEPLVKAVACKWIQKGTIRFNHNNRQGTLNFGTGDCDNKATLAVGNLTKEITLP
jgi:hypothetical protein